MSDVKKLNFSAENLDEPLRQELKHRRVHLDKIMQERGLDAVLIVGNNVVGPPVLGCFRYFTGHKVYFQYQALIARPGTPTTVFASSVLHKNALEARGITDIRVSPDMLGSVLSEFREHPVRRLGLLLDMLPSLWYLELIKLGIEATDILKDIVAIRYERSEFEIQATRTSAKIADIGYRAVCHNAKPGVRLTDLYAELDYSMKAAGAEETFTLMSSGRFSFEDNKLPCIRPYILAEDRVVKSGECVAMEITPRYMGYWTQMVRTICIGEPNPDLEIAHRDLIETQEAAVPLLKPGMNLEEVMTYMCKYGENLGYESKLPFGHIAGIDLDEGWQYAAESDIVLKSGMALVIHPTLVTPKIDYGIFWGDTYLITENGGECITSQSSELLTV